MSTWQQLKAAWTWAVISDAEFIRRAYAIGFGLEARELVKQDLETP
jgi:hypothetical protein